MYINPCIAHLINPKYLTYEIGRGVILDSKNIGVMLEPRKHEIYQERHKISQK